MGDELIDAIMAAIKKREEDPNTPRCQRHYCKGTSMMNVPFDINGEEVWLELCYDCHDVLGWVGNGYIPNIKTLCEGINLREPVEPQIEAAYRRGYNDALNKGRKN